MSEAETYRHTQKGPWGLMCYAFAAAFLTANWAMPVPVPRMIFFAAGILMLLLAGSLGQLTVADEGDHLGIRFGPLPLFRKRIFYDDIVEVEKGRTNFLDGWGIHWNPWHGWVWSIWGRDCVVIHLKRGTIRVGTDDPDGLLTLLNDRITGGRSSE